jgi:hypothetical protein
MYTLRYIVVVYCISLRRGVSVNEYYYYYYYYYYAVSVWRISNCLVATEIRASHKTVGHQRIGI